MTERDKHDFKKVSLVIVSILLFSTVVLLNQLAARKKFIFPNDVGSISREFKLDITPAGYVFPVIWSIIFLWQGAWLVYAFVCLFRRTEDDCLLYKKVDILNTGFFVAFIANMIGMIAWLFLWTNKLIGWSFGCLLYLTLALYLAVYIFLKNFYSIQYELLNINLKKDIWINRVLVQNGLVFYLTWVTIATLLNLSTFLTYDLKIEMSISSTSSLSVIAVLITAYFIVENFVWQKYLLYIFTPWIVLMVGLSGSLLKNWPRNGKPPSRNNIMTLVILCSLILFSVVKVVMFSLYHTVCKQKVDKKESHKLLQLKQNQMIET